MGDLAHIAVSEPSIGQDDIDAVNDALRSGWISSSGPHLTQFETTWAAYCERAHGVAVTSGTTALELAVEALDLQPGDEVIIPAFTIISCALAVIRASATPVLVDADPITWCMDGAQVAARITPRTRAIMPVHIYGHPCEMDPLLELADTHGLAIVEDAAEAHGAEYLSRRSGTPTWRRCGSFGNSSVFSFYANKLVTTGEGGMIVTDDEALAARLRSLRNLAFRADRRFYHTEIGHQYRMTNVQAALGVSQVKRMSELVKRKRWIGEAYREGLADLNMIELPTEEPWARSVYWMYGIVLRDDAKVNAKELAERLATRGVETRPFFLGMHEQPALLDRGLFRGERYPVSERLAQRGLYLPSGLGLTEIQLSRVCDAVQEILR
ncbi:MAG: DegT/DnrJ/EryC1/StrS aminotransferase [Gemmatimonadetes bacterium]|nr:DegT/DnrJ/EryC1/StrS aminotransferase [Gemmatimonadota bacterium]